MPEYPTGATADLAAVHVGSVAAPVNNRLTGQNDFTTTGVFALRAAASLNAVADIGGIALGPPPGTITAADGGAGVLPAGTYIYAMTEVDSSGETTMGPQASVAVGVNHQISLTVPISRRGVQARHLYRKSPGSSSFKLAHDFGGANGYFQTTWVDNTLDGTLGAVAPITDSSGYWTFVVSDLPAFRLHPTLSDPVDDLALLTKKPGVSGSYSMDAYGTILVRDSAGSCFSAQHVGTNGDLYYGEYLPNADTSPGIPNTSAATKVFGVGGQGAAYFGTLDTTIHAVEIVPLVALGAGIASLDVESLAGSTGPVLQVVDRSTGYGLAVTSTAAGVDGVGDAIYVNISNAASAANALNLTNLGTGALIVTNTGWGVGHNGNMNLLNVASPNYFRFIEFWSQLASDRPLLIRGLGAGGQTANLTEWMPNPTAGTIPLAVDANGNLVADTAVGFKVGAAANQKIGFWGKTPVVQPSGTSAASTDLASVIALANSLRANLLSSGQVA